MNFFRIGRTGLVDGRFDGAWEGENDGTPVGRAEATSCQTRKEK